VRIHGPETPKELAEFSIDSQVKDLAGLLTEMANNNDYYARLLLRGGSLRTDISILVNGRSCMFLGGLQAEVRQGDVVDILLPMIGG
jgi:molybdopterin converting factor small subunit